jgi:type I restriction enzyme S subunit
MSEMVPEGWEIKNLGDLTTVITKGTTPKTYCNEGINFIKVESISTSKTLIPEKFAKIDFLTHQSQKRSQLKHGDILFGIAGSLGRLAVVEAKDLPANTNQALAIIRLDNGTINRSFCLHQLAADKIQLEIKNLQTVGAQPNLSLKQVSDFEVYAPPLPEQKKIASILTSVDEVIETTQKQIDKLQDLKKATMNELLTKGIGHTEFKESELGRIPKSWEVKSLGDIAKFSQGVQVDLEFHFEKPDQDKIRFVRISDYTKTNEPPRYIEKTLAVKGLVSENDIVMIRYGEAGRICRGLVGAIANNLFTIRPFQNLSREYLYHYLNAEEVMKKIKELAASSAMPAISFSSLKPIKVKIPSFNEQTEIASKTAIADSHIKLLSKKLAQTQSLKKSLMQDLLTGKVRVQVH